MPHRLTIRAAARSIALLVAEGAAMLHRRSIRAATLSIALMVVTASITQAAGVGRSPGTAKPAAAVAAAGIKTSSLSDHAKRGPIAHGSPKRASSRTSGVYAPKLLSPFTHAAGSGGSQAPQARAPRAAAPTNSTTNGNPDIQQHPGFQGMTRSGGPDNDGEPPDPFVAVGPEHVMQILNSSFRTTDRQGAEADISSLSGFVDSFSFAGLGSQQWFDPRVIYDSLHNRWLMTMAGIDCVPDGVNADFGNGYLFFATSDTIDPTGFWTGSYFQFFDFLVDFPAPGTSTDKIGFATNLFSMSLAGSCAGVGAGDDYFGSDILVMDWADWLGTDNNVDVREISTDTT